VCGHTFLFGSEVKALLVHPLCQAQMDKEALVEYFTFQNLFTDRTLFAGIRLLPAGSCMRIRLGAGESDLPHRYWDFSFSEHGQARDEREYADELDRLLRQALNRQLISDVDVGAYLSGGMDSGTLTALATQQLPYMKTFTCGFDLHSASGIELSFDERTKAEWMSYCFKTEHYEIVLKAGDMERAMQRLTWHLEEPRVGQSYPNFYAAQLASKFVKVVLSGTGGDEMFGGYPWRYYRAAVNRDFDDYIEKYYRYWQRLMDNRILWRLFAPIKSEVQHVWTQDIFRDVFHNHEHKLETPEDYVNHSLCFEARTFLHGLLVVEDKLSMAHSLETRVPFLDNDLVDFAMKLPVRCKVANLSEMARINENEPGDKRQLYFQKTHDGKLLLRQVMARYVPSEIAEADKQGFSAPDASWFKGDSIDYVRRTLLDGHARLYDYMDRNAVQELIAEHVQGKQNKRLLIWSLLSFENWLKTFVS
jgi:asparagine synthase (glutamine-hydrolysing)